jgi:hypothetical protein
MANTSIVLLHIRALPFYNSWQGDILGVAVQHLKSRLDSLQWEWAFRAAHVYT